MRFCIRRLWSGSETLAQSASPELGFDCSGDEAVEFFEVELATLVAEPCLAICVAIVPFCLSHVLLLFRTQRTRGSEVGFFDNGLHM